jgi:hypothetical protein
MIDKEGRVWMAYAGWHTNGFVDAVRPGQPFEPLKLPAGVKAAKAVSADTGAGAIVIDTKNRIWTWPLSTNHAGMAVEIK